MKNVMCFGDSNTYALKPDKTGRFPQDVRWTSLLQNLLGCGYHIIEEGLCGRTVESDDPDMPCGMNGMQHIEMLMHSHFPLDLIVVMLGTNSLKTKFALSAEDIASQLDRMISKILSYPCEIGNVPQILVVAPCKVDTDHTLTVNFDGKEEDSKRLTPLYGEIAKKHNLPFLSIVDLVVPSTLDGLHLPEEMQPIVAKAMFEKISEIFG